MLEIVLVIVVLMVLVTTLLPFTIYLCVKVGTYAFYRGRKLFEDQEKPTDGRHKRET